MRKAKKAISDGPTCSSYIQTNDAYITMLYRKPELFRIHNGLVAASYTVFGQGKRYAPCNHTIGYD